MATIVIRSKTKSRIDGTCYPEYSVHYINRTRTGELYISSRLITKERSYAMIKRLGLVESYSTNDGQIYDTPEGDLKALFPNGLHNKKEIEIIEKADMK